MIDDLRFLVHSGCMIVGKTIYAPENYEEWNRKTENWKAVNRLMQMHGYVFDREEAK